MGVLFSNTADLKRFVPNQLHGEMSWANYLENIVDQQTALNIIPYISQTEHDALVSVYGGSPSTQQAQAIKYIQTALANYTLVYLLDANRLKVSAMGVQEGSSSDGTSVPASFHAIADVKNRCAETADSFMDMALAYMEANKGSFTDWAASDEYTEIKELFVSSTAILNKYCKTGNSRRTFLAIRSELEMTQDEMVQAILGTTMYDALLAAYQANTTTAAQDKVVKRVQKYMATEAVRRAIPSHYVEFIHGGIVFRSYLDGSVRKDTAGKEAVRMMMKDMELRAEKTRTDLLKFLNDNATDYPDFTESEYYFSQVSEDSYKIPNNRGKNSFRL